MKYEDVKEYIPEIEWKMQESLINDIQELKKMKNAVILAHNYQTPDIYHCVADVTGDSLKLAFEGAKQEADVIVLAGVHFMAETAKLMSPEKTVLMPDMNAGCSLAASITGEDVRQLKKQHPGIPVVTYVNTSAEVKAESDICCTSGNAVEVVNSLGVDKAIVIPDEYLANWIANQTDVEIITWNGRCEVHERFDVDEINSYRMQDPELTVLAHPECSPEVQKSVDFCGSTAIMSQYVKENQPKKVLMLTECSMSDNVSVENPDVEFIRPCNLCPHMKQITLKKIRDSLITLTPRVEIDPAIAVKARESITKMLGVK